MNDWMMGYQAGILDRPVRRAAMAETTALGAAGLAGIATGVWGSASEFLEAQGEPDRFPAALSPALRRDAMAQWRRAVRAAVHWANDVAS